MKGRLKGIFKVGIRFIFSAAIPLIVATSVLGNAYSLGFFNMSGVDSVPFLPLWRVILDLVNPIFLLFSLVFSIIFIVPEFLSLFPILAVALYILTIIQKKTGYNTFACYIYSFFILLSLSFVYSILAHRYYHLYHPESLMEVNTEIYFSYVWVFLGSLWGAAYFSIGYKLPLKLMSWCKIFIFFMASIWLDTIIVWYVVFPRI